MNFVNKIQTLFIVPAARKHILKVIGMLKQSPYEKLINLNYEKITTRLSMDKIVKSYFWASRTIKKDLCLPRSIALYQYLKAAGYAVEHKFGVNKKDQTLAAHSWVEYQQLPLNELPNLKDKFKVMEKIKT